MKRFVLILLKIRIYVETFKDTNNKLIPFFIDDVKLLETYKLRLKA